MEQSVKKCVLFTNYKAKTAVINYRFTSPAREAGVELTIGSSEKDLKLIEDSDIVFIDREFPRNFSLFLKVKKKCRKYSKHLVTDMDDFLFGMEDDHPNRLDLGYASLLAPLCYAIKTIDALVVSTSCLAEECRPLTSRIFVFNNYLDDKTWEFKTPTLAKKELVKILFMGTKSHQPDLHLIAEPLRNVLLTFPNQAEFTCYGLELPEQLKYLENAKQVNVFKTEYQDFVKDITSHEFDIGIGPLQENTFNNSKSSIKYYEYSALGLASVMSDTEPYTQVISHGIDGILAKTSQDWENTLTQLVENGSFRNELAVRAQEKVRKTALLSENSHRWQEVLEKVICLPKKSTDDQDFSILEVALVEQDRLNKHYEKEVAANSKVIMDNQAAFDELRQDINKLNMEAAAMAASTSWGMTRPMRMVVRKLLKR